jgi:hypothetical protein
MPASIASTSTMKKEEGDVSVEPVSTAPYLSGVKEEDEDEGAAIAGFERNSYTEEEERAVKRKLDRRVRLFFLTLPLHLSSARRR